MTRQRIPRRREPPASGPASPSAVERGFPAFADPRLRGARSDVVRAALARQAQALAGNHAVAGVLARAAPVAPAPPEHFTGSELDAMLAASPFLSAYIAPKAAGGDVIAGNIHHHPHDEFVVRAVAYLQASENPKTGKVYTLDEANAFVKQMRGFHDRTTGQIHIDRDLGIHIADMHEAIHHYAHATWRSQAGFNTNEGVTECFTRRLCKDTRTPNPMQAYREQFLSAFYLAEAVTWEVLAEAYFNGDMAGLARAVEALDGDGTLADWQRAMEEGRYKDADAVVGAPK